MGPGMKGDAFLVLLVQGRKEERKEGRKEERKEGGREGRREGERRIRK